MDHDANAALEALKQIDSRFETTASQPHRAHTAISLIILTAITVAFYSVLAGAIGLVLIAFGLSAHYVWPIIVCLLALLCIWTWVSPRHEIRTDADGRLLHNIPFERIRSVAVFARHHYSMRPHGSQYTHSTLVVRITYWQPTGDGEGRIWEKDIKTCPSFGPDAHAFTFARHLAILLEMPADPSFRSLAMDSACKVRYSSITYVRLLGHIVCCDARGKEHRIRGFEVLPQDASRYAALQTSRNILPTRLYLRADDATLVTRISTRTFRIKRSPYIDVALENGRDAPTWIEKSEIIVA